MGLKVAGLLSKAGVEKQTSSKQLGSVLNDTSLRNYCGLTLINAFYLLRLFKVKELSLLTLPNVSLYFRKLVKWAVLEENGF